MLNVRGIKARPHDLETMLDHKPSLVEMHCSVDDLKWEPTRRYDLPLAVHLPEYHEGRLVDPAALGETERQAAANLYAEAVRRAAAWAPAFAGKPKVVFHPGGMSVNLLGGRDVLRARAQLDKTIAAMTAAAGAGVEVLVENLPAHCWFFGGEWLANLATTPEAMASICREHEIGMTLDLCHLYLASQAQSFDVDEAVERLAPYTRHVHYSGAKGVDGEGLALSDPENAFDFGRAVAPLRALDVTAVPEVWFGHEQAGAGFAQAWKDAERIISMRSPAPEVPWRS